MERKYENVYLVTSPDIQVQNLLETMSDLMVGNLYVTEKMIGLRPTLYVLTRIFAGIWNQNP